MASPQSETAGIEVTAELVADGCEVVKQTQFLVGEVLRIRRRIDVEAREGEDCGHSPRVDGCFDGFVPEQIRLVRSSGSVVGHGNILVRASDLVLGAVAALRKVLVAANVTTFARRSQLVQVQNCIVGWADVVYDISTYQFSQPLRDLVWLRRGGPPPGPAILAAEIKIKVVVARKYENAARKRGRAEYEKSERMGVWCG